MPAVVCLVAHAVGCGGGNDGPSTFYSCNDVKRSSPDGNGKVTETRFCQEYTFKIDPSLLQIAIDANGNVCKAALGSNETATWSTKPCPTDSSLIAICDDPMSSEQTQRKLYHYYDTVDGQPKVDPQLPAVYVAGGCTLPGGASVATGTGGASGSAGPGGSGGASQNGGSGGMSGAGGVSGASGAAGGLGATGTCADLSACCNAIKDATAKATCVQLEATYQSMAGHGLTQAQADSDCAVFLQLERTGTLCP